MCGRAIPSDGQSTASCAVALAVHLWCACVCARECVRACECARAHLRARLRAPAATAPPWRGAAHHEASTIIAWLAYAVKTVTAKLSAAHDAGAADSVIVRLAGQSSSHLRDR